MDFQQQQQLLLLLLLLVMILQYRFEARLWEPRMHQTAHRSILTVQTVAAGAGSGGTAGTAVGSTDSNNVDAGCTDHTVVTVVVVDTAAAAEHDDDGEHYCGDTVAGDDYSEVKIRRLHQHRHGHHVRHGHDRQDSASQFEGRRTDLSMIRHGHAHGRGHGHCY
jgi:hypothetical protein